MRAFLWINYMLTIVYQWWVTHELKEFFLQIPPMKDWKELWIMIVQSYTYMTKNYIDLLTVSKTKKKLLQM